MAYATVAEVEAGFRLLTADEKELATALLDEAAIIIDAFKKTAADDAKRLVSCRMVRRQLGASINDIPMGATQGSMSGLGYSQSWTVNSGAVGELYLGKLEKQMLGMGNQIGSYSPVEELICTESQ